MGLRDVEVTGGQDTIRESQDLDRRSNVVIATPGRLADHNENISTFSLAKVKYLVLDEADSLLEGKYCTHLVTIVVVTQCHYTRLGGGHDHARHKN